MPDSLDEIIEHYHLFVYCHSEIAKTCDHEANTLAGAKLIPSGLLFVYGVNFFRPPTGLLTLSIWLFLLF